MRERASERSAACATCGKTFARSDTLLRHEKSHLATEDRGPVHRVTNGTFRACCACAQARSRCSGGNPCGRCKIRSLECVYPAKRRKVVSSLDNDRSIGGKVSNLQEYSSPDQPQAGRNPSQFQELVFSSAGEEPSEAVVTVDLKVSQPTQPLSGIHEPLRPSQLNGPTAHPEYSSNFNQPLLSTQGRPADVDLQAMDTYGDDMVSRDRYGIIMGQQNYQQSVEPQVSDFTFGAPYEDSMSLNWIPLSVYPSPYGDLEQDFAFLVPAMSGTTEFDGSQFDFTAHASTGLNQDFQMLRGTIEGSGSNTLLGFGQSPSSSTSEGFGTMQSSYSDGHATELRKKQKRLPSAPNVFDSPRSTSDEFFFPDVADLTTQYPIPDRCSEAQHFLIRQAFGQLCLHTTHFKPFTAPTFPDIKTLGICVDLYFEHFHPSFPLIHTPSFASDTPWIVLLAVATVGSNFARVSARSELREAFQEFLRRAVLKTSDSRDTLFKEPQLVQALILNLVSLAQSDRVHLRSQTPRFHVDLARWCLESGILQLAEPDPAVPQGLTAEQLRATWHKWIDRETNRRLGYFVWLLDCTHGYMCNSRPLCNMDDARASLPCSEALWHASSPEAWFELAAKAPTMPSLCAALEDMYGRKKVMSGMSEVSYILLIHALYSRTWEVGTHIKQPLSEWRSTGNARGFLNTPSKDDFWLPLYPLYANWRNSACDCLDVLHWQASSVVAQAAGNEHHGVLQLHLARIILLTPFQELQDLIFFMIDDDVGDESKASFYVHDGSYQRRNRGKANQIRKITQRWLCEDQHKARLAMVHAGSVFWYVRRYSSGSFYEPLAVYLASIVLWTYGSYKSAALERQTNTDSLLASPVAHDMQRLSAHQDCDNQVQPTRVEMAAQIRAWKQTPRSHYSSPDVAQSTGGGGGGSRSHKYTPSANSVTFSADGSQRGHANSVGHYSSNTTTNKEDNDNLEERTTSQRGRGIPFEAHLDADEKMNRNEPNKDDEDDDEGEDEAEDEEDQDQPQFIHLDRPCDDEIVQHFVRSGHNMAGHMSNVGDICKTPNKVLTEGARLLKGKLTCWGISRKYHDVLIKVATTNNGGRGAGRSKIT